MCFPKELLFKILQNLLKSTCAGVFLNNATLATLINKDSGNGAFLWILEIIKDTYFMKRLRGIALSTGKIPMIAGWRYHFLALWGFSFWLIAFSWTLAWNVGILSSNVLLKNEGIHSSSQEFYLCYQWYVFQVCHCCKDCKSLITICYLHDFFLSSFRIFFAVRRSFLIFLFLLNQNILIRNLLWLRCFCAVCLCYA